MPIDIWIFRIKPQIFENWSEQLERMQEQRRGRNQVSERVSISCWHTTNIANAPFQLKKPKPFQLKKNPQISTLCSCTIWLHFNHGYMFSITTGESWLPEGTCFKVYYRWLSMRSVYLLKKCAFCGFFAPSLLAQPYFEFGFQISTILDIAQVQYPKWVRSIL